MTVPRMNRYLMLDIKGCQCGRALIHHYCRLEKLVQNCYVCGRPIDTREYTANITQMELYDRVKVNGISASKIFSYIDEFSNISEVYLYYHYRVGRDHMNMLVDLNEDLDFKVRRDNGVSTRYYFIA